MKENFNAVSYRIADQNHNRWFGIRGNQLTDFEDRTIFSDFEDALQTHEAAYRIYFIRFTFSLFYNTVFYFFKELA